MLYYTITKIAGVSRIFLLFRVPQRGMRNYYENSRYNCNEQGASVAHPPLKTIDPRDLKLAPVRQLLDDWMLLTAGDFQSGLYNTMTVAWGFIGAMWKRPVMITPVRPTRYTREFMELYDTWTLCAFPDEYRGDLQLLGTRSGRDGNKIDASGLTSVASRHAVAPGFAESMLTVECRTVYYNDIVPGRMKDPSIDGHYKDDYHRMYYGEILHVAAALEG